MNDDNSIPTPGKGVTSSDLFGLSWNECRSKHGHRAWEAASPFHCDGSRFMFRVIMLRSGKLWHFFEDSDPEARISTAGKRHWPSLKKSKAAFQAYANEVVAARAEPPS